MMLHAQKPASLSLASQPQLRSSPSCRPPLRRRHERAVVRAYETVDVETERQAPPDGRWGAPPPPPPPPPQPNMRRSPQAPSRREALFGFLGAGIGTAITATYYNTQYDLSDDSYEKALDALLDNPDFLSAVEDEVLYKAYGGQLDELGENLEDMQSLDKELSSLKDDLERLSVDDSPRK